MYTTGQFAKKANVTIRTIRYYDKQGILKPSHRNEAGYRLYTDEDFGRLQKILSLKYLGFSLEEIMNMTINDAAEDISYSLQMQTELVQKRIRHLQLMEKALKDTTDILQESQTVDWNSILNLIHLTNMERSLVDQYKNAVNLDIRIALHRDYSQNPEPWFGWLMSQIALTDMDSILEIGCGNGELWTHASKEVIKDKYICLTDISSGMVEDASQRLKQLGLRGFHFGTVDCQAMPFENGRFDAVVGNHVLFYAKNMGQALNEVKRVLKPGGTFFCSAYGKSHMKEITELVQQFDPRITLSEVALYEIFGLENGQDILGEYFESIELRRYDDFLLVDGAGPVLDYILSCHGNQSEILNQRQLEFKEFLQQKIKKDGAIRITKDAGLFVCRVKKFRNILTVT